MRSRLAMAAVALAAAGHLLAGARSAKAFEAFDGRFQLHGFGEVQLRALNADYSDDWDLAQWYWILNLEIELDILPDGWGPIAAMSAFSRVEVRYDCVWTRGCGMFPSADLYGDRANKGPDYLADGVESELLGTAFGATDPTGSPPSPSRGQDWLPDRRIGNLGSFSPFEALFEGRGPDGTLFTLDDPAPLVFNKVKDYGFFLRGIRGPANGIGTQVFGPWRPKDWIHSIALVDDFPDPFNPNEEQPSLLAAIGLGLPLSGADGIPGTADDARPQPGNAAYPFRPQALFLAQETNVPRTEAKGNYFPSAALARNLRKGKSFNNFDQNFRQAELEWNHGAAQQDEKELKEAYLDIEFFDGQLWLRLGKQTIVWGKTELFRSQDQFNPQDFGLAALPSLEESRIGLWAARATWSFYEVGPLQDVRLELAFNYDEFEPADLGRCGEPFSPSPSCSKAFALFAHGLAGLGLAGEFRPEKPWDSTRGIEGGARLEWRWRRFSFALTDFYGFDDFPYLDPIFNYERNVDPRTGRPRRTNSRGGCDPDGLFGGDTSACLPEASLFVGGAVDPDTNRVIVPNSDAVRDDTLRNTSVNQATFRVLCSATIGFVGDTLPGGESECSVGIFGSQADFLGKTVAGLIAIGLSGGDPATIDGLVGAVTDIPEAVIRQVYRTTPASIDDPNNSPTTAGFFGFNDSLTAEQRALLGCGPFYGTDCDIQGIDLLNAEASALFQSIAGFEGTPLAGFRTDDPSIPQPGTIGFQGGTPCTRFEGGTLVILPGCHDGSTNRAPGDPGQSPDWRIGIDGNPVFDNPAGAPGAGLPDRIMEFNARTPCTVAAGDDLLHPWTCQTFRNELAVISWNFQQLLIIFSTDDDDGVLEQDELDQPTLADLAEFDALIAAGDFVGAALLQVEFRDRLLVAGRCSFTTPQYCTVLSSLYSITGVRRRDVRAGGNGRFGRRDFSYHSSQELVVRYAKRNVFGFSMDFSEDVSKTNWNLEFTWVEDLPLADTSSRDGLNEVDQFRLTVSIDRPTFINFLNANRTLFINTQWFISYTSDYTNAFTANGPWNVLATLTVFTGYFQDRLNPAMTLVYDIESNSGAGLPRVSYRFTENFSATFGLAIFFGRFQAKDQFISPRSAPNQAGDDVNRQFVENSLSLVRDRDEVFLRVRWSF